MSDQLVILALESCGTIDESIVALLEGIGITEYCIMEASIRLWIETMYTGETITTAMIENHVDDICDLNGISTAKDPYSARAKTLFQLRIESTLHRLSLPLGKLELLFRDADLIDTRWMGNNLLLTGRYMT